MQPLFSLNNLNKKKYKMNTIKAYFTIIFIALSLISLSSISQEAEIISDIYNGTPDSNIFGFIETEGLLYFNASTEEFPHHIWTYNGENAPSLCSGIPTEDFNYVYTIGEYNNSLVFKGDSDEEGEELYIYDGINDPVQISNLKPGTEDSFQYLRQRYFTLDDKFYIVANDGETGMEWWVYDGTNPIYLLSDLTEGNNSSEPSMPIELNDKLYFRVWDPTIGYKLWEYDGINPPQIITQIGGDINYTIGNFCKYDNILYLEKNGDAPEIWKYNGVDSPTLLSELTYNNDTIRSIKIFGYNNKLCIFGINPITTGSYYGDLELWECDETGTTIKIATLYNNDSYSGIDVIDIAFINNKLIMALSYEDDGGEVCVYDGSNIEVIATVPFNGYYEQDILAVGDTAYFQNYDETNHVELWGYNGIAEPFLVSDIKEGDTYFNGSSNPRQFIEFNNKLLFTAEDNIHGRELWQYGVSSSSIISNEYSNISIFPNPTEGVISIQSNDNKEIIGIKIFSITGKLIQSITNLYSDVYRFKINAPNGLYIIEVETLARKEYLKVVKE